MAVRAAADASDRAMPVTSCPAVSSSSTVWEPIQPDAPVTNTFMTSFSFVLRSSVVYEV